MGIFRISMQVMFDHLKKKRVNKHWGPNWDIIGISHKLENDNRSKYCTINSPFALK